MSTTGIRRVLQRALKNSSKRVAPNIVKSIEGNSNGDVRHALNMLQFVSLGGPSAILSSSSPRTWGRQPVLGLTHAVGRLLRAKDDMDADATVSAWCTSNDAGPYATSNLLSFMQFNALDHIGSCEDLEAAFDAFSAADILSAQSSKRFTAATKHAAAGDGSLTLASAICGSFSARILRVTNKSRTRGFKQVRRPLNSRSEAHCCVVDADRARIGSTDRRAAEVEWIRMLHPSALRSGGENNGRTAQPIASPQEPAKEIEGDEIEEDEDDDF